MFQRLRLLASTFVGHFETMLQQEIAKVDLADYPRRAGVLVPRGLVAPPIIAFYKATKLALRAQPVCNVEPMHGQQGHGQAEHGVRAVEHAFASGERDERFPLASIPAVRSVSATDAPTERPARAGKLIRKSMFAQQDPIAAGRENRQSNVSG